MRPITSTGRSCVASTCTIHLAQCIAIGATGKWGRRARRLEAVPGGVEEGRVRAIGDDGGDVGALRGGLDRGDGAHRKADHADAAGIDLGPLLQILHRADDVVGLMQPDADELPVALAVGPKVEAQHVVAGRAEAQGHRQALAPTGPDAVAQHDGRARRWRSARPKNQPLMCMLSSGGREADFLGHAFGRLVGAPLALRAGELVDQSRGR